MVGFCLISGDSDFVQQLKRVVDAGFIFFAITPGKTSAGVRVRRSCDLFHFAHTSSYFCLN
jgi:hypothetical protein